MISRPIPAQALAAALALILGVACGPVEYVNQVTRRAAFEVAGARAAGADKAAPYEYTLAVEYLHKAREEAGFADFQAAVRFGRKAEEMGRAARTLAGELAPQDGDQASPASRAEGGE